jgi:hypothetical protein
VTVAAPTPTGIPSADVRFAITNYGAGGGNLTIDADTGTISGFITAAGSVTVKYTESADGVDIRSGTYAVTYTLDTLTLDIESMTTVDGETYASRRPKMTNTLAGGVLSLSGQLPDGLTFISATGQITGTPTTIGSFPLVMTYTDPYQTLNKSLTLRVSDGSTGHRYWRFTGKKNTQYAGQVFELNLYSSNLNAVAAGTITGGANMFDDNVDTLVNMPSTATVLATIDFGKKMPLDKMVSTQNAGFSTSVSLTAFWSDDNTIWTQAGASSTGADTATATLSN